MEENNIGEIIGTLRYKGNMTRIELCKGICSPVTLLRIEEGIRIPDKFLLEALFERLGIAQDKMEDTIMERDYFLQDLRYKIVSHINRGEYSEARKLIVEYKSRKEIKHIFHKQFVCRVEAILALKEEKNREKYITYLRNAIGMTFSGLKDKTIEKRLLSEEEITLSLMLAKEFIKKDQEKTLCALRKLQMYVQSNYEDPKVKVKIYPKVYYIVGLALKEKGYYEEMLELCERGIHLLKTNGILSGLEHLLCLLLECKKLSGFSDIKELKAEIATLHKVYKEYNIIIGAGLWERAIDEEVFLINELIRKNRVVRKVTQEGLAEAINCEQKAISDMELAVRGPTRPSYLRLRKYLKINQNYYRGFIVSDIVEDHFMRAEISRLNSILDYEEAEKLFIQLSNKLSKSKKENVQYILWMETLFKQSQGEIQAKEAIDNYYKALYITIPDFDEEKLPSYVLARKEVYILNGIAISKSLLGEKKEALDILNALMIGYRDSEVDLKYHIDGVRETMLHLALIQKDGDDIEEVIKICDEAIRLCLEGGNGRYVGRFLAVKGYMLERMAKKEKKPSYKKKAFRYFKKAFRMSKMMLDYVTAKEIDIYCKKYAEWEESLF